jgi:hypothetical protein
LAYSSKGIPSHKLVGLVYLVDLVHLVYPVIPVQPNKQDKLINTLLPLAGFFSILVARIIHE